MKYTKNKSMWTLLRLVLICGAVPVIAIVSGQFLSARPSAYAAVRSAPIYLPLVMKNYLAPLCRFGVGAQQDIGSYGINPLRIGWYVDWGATLSPARPAGMTYVPTIRLQQTGDNSYALVSPTSSALTATILANPGSLWLIGNEPDRRQFQDNLIPSVYARAYHDLYYTIKNIDPTARIGAGGIVQPTPIRMQYLDMVLNSYTTTLSVTTMPVDVWNIHAFILNETSCSYDPSNCWGAEIPPGITANFGMQYTVQDNDNLTIFEQNLVAFRQWMANKGYQNVPLIITEFGVQMPGGGYFDPDFSPQRVNAFMNSTFNYLSSTTSSLGYPGDNYHLVQRWAWYSLTDTNFNGWLFDPSTKARTVFGDNYAAYTAGVTTNSCGW